MKALAWQRGLEFKIEDIPEPNAEPGRVVVRVEAAAICGTDLHTADFGITGPLVLGHEVAGVVHEIGDDAGGLAVGDRVALDPVQVCGACWPCLNGMEHLCGNCRHLGYLDTAGGWAEYVAIDAANAHAIPEGVDFAAACLAEPMAVCYESFQRAGLKEGDAVLIIGDGPFGFLHAQIARAMGAGKIVVAGHYDKRLARISQATGAISCNTHHEDLAGVLAGEIGSPGADIVIEATGAGASANIGLKALRPRGTIVVFSYVWEPEPLDMALVHMRELNVLGSCRSLNAYKKCLDLMGQGQVDTGLLVDLQISLEDYSTALDKLLNHKEDIFKAVFILP